MDEKSVKRVRKKDLVPVWRVVIGKKRMPIYIGVAGISFLTIERSRSISGKAPFSSGQIL